MKHLILLTIIVVFFSQGYAQGNARYRCWGKTKTGKSYFGVKDKKTEKIIFHFPPPKKPLTTTGRKNQTQRSTILLNPGMSLRYPLSAWKPSGLLHSSSGTHHSRIRLNVGGGPRLGSFLSNGARDFALGIFPQRSITLEEGYNTHPRISGSNLSASGGDTQLSDYFVLRNDNGIRYQDPTLFVQERGKGFVALRSRNTLFFIKLKMWLGKSKKR